MQFFGDRDAAAAERSFQRAIALNPNYPVAHQWYAVLLSERGRDAEARRHADLAVALDPMEATMHQSRGLVDYYAGRFGEAATAERKARSIYWRDSASAATCRRTSRSIRCSRRCAPTRVTRN